jgi:hypothetical protein
VQRRTEAQCDRYRGNEQPGRSGRNSKRTVPRRKKLGLPLQADVSGKFFGLAGRMGHTPEKKARRPRKPHPPNARHKLKTEDREKAWDHGVPKSGEGRHAKSGS